RPVGGGGRDPAGEVAHDTLLVGWRRSAPATRGDRGGDATMEPPIAPLSPDEVGGEGGVQSFTGACAIPARTRPATGRRCPARSGPPRGRRTACPSATVRPAPPA